MSPRIVYILLIALAVVLLYDTFTTITLQYDHTVMCHALAQTDGIIYANTGCG